MFPDHMTYEFISAEKADPDASLLGAWAVAPRRAAGDHASCEEVDLDASLPGAGR